MNRECLCDITSEEYSEEKKEEETSSSNRIFLNFSREFRHPAKDRYNMAKVKELFEYLSERQDLQEMKVSGWLDDGREDEVEEEECKDGLESFCEGSTPKGGGQRFAMSRDFWYRKLNTLKAQKLDEAALEAKDIPPGNGSQEPKCIKYIRNQKIYSDQLPEPREEVMREIDCFNETVAKPVERVLRTGFVNVYDNREHFKGSCE